MKKRTIVLILGIALLAIFIAACASKPTPAKMGGVPDFVNEALANASEDVLVGVGQYKGTDGQARTYATNRARAEISRQLNSVVRDMIQDYDARSEQDPTAIVSFQNNITETLSKSTLQGSKPIDFQIVDGTYWVVVEYSKSAAANEVSRVANQAAAAAKLAPAAAAAFDARGRMKTAFDEISPQNYEYVPVTD